MLLKNKIFSGLGSSLEWFDFALYGFLAPIFSSLFFSPAIKSEWLRLSIAYGIFAIGFAARPIGALIFGYIGDKHGRLIALRITPILAALTSVVIAFLPTYKVAGNLAIFLLLITRIIQGIFLGGEFSGNIVYLCESSKTKKYFWGSIGSCTGSLGIILASLASSIFYSVFTHHFMYTYGWRIAFLISVPLGIIAFILRLKMTESPEFSKNNTAENPLAITFKKHKVKLLKCLGLIYLHATSFYFVFMFLPVFLTKIRHLNESAALLKNTGFLIIHLCFIPLFGILVNFLGGMKSLLTISIVFVLTTMPLFYFIAYGTDEQLYFCLFVFSITTAFNAAIIPGLMAMLIPANVRYTILGLAFNIGFGFFGGVVPLLALLLIHHTGSTLSPAVYLTFASLITLITGFTIKVGEKNEIR